jgi:hypothetical protein
VFLPIITSQRMEYSTTFAAGTLLHDEASRIIAAAEKEGTLSAVDPSVLDINSKSGRERRFREVERRLENIDQNIWSDFQQRTQAEQRVVLYYACMKTYTLVADIHVNAVLPAWRSITQELHRADIQRFLDEQVTAHPEIDEWSESTHDKVQQVVRKMLRQVGLLDGDRLQRLQLPRSFWVRFVRAGDVWFLEAMFLSEEERAQVVDLVRTT